MNRRAGHTLLEMLSVLAVAALLMGMAAPSLQALLQRQRLTTTANDFFAAVTLTRSEALRRGTPVVLLASGAGWDSGWMVLVDRNGNLRPDAGEDIVASHGPPPAGIAITGNFNDNRVPHIAYGANGRSRTGSGSAQAGSWEFRAGDLRRKVIVNLLGRPRACNPERDKSAC
ncbi:GspH/FimT family pseudopilin|uniref:GspH/FimT family pseudopilin n=1 Tax=Noviherbaspirillum sp. L7-7A TaxID=2850560 RepID=UPI001C2BE52E|nr:GspH/FimT family pseudopilin [Noviherbaspirillum sp. L7-7A]MBV0880057.1 GspH/FimT family pseudopilin [Noviherbaspirillum sp. L7-7A]